MRLVIEHVCLAIPDGETVIGRTDDANVQVDHREISRRHAVLRRRGNIVEIKDCGSANGTFVNSVAATDWARVYAGDDVRLGPILMRVVSRSATRTRADETRPTLPSPNPDPREKPTRPWMRAVRPPSAKC